MNEWIDHQEISVEEIIPNKQVVGKTPDQTTSHSDDVGSSTADITKGSKFNNPNQTKDYLQAEDENQQDKGVKNGGENSLQQHLLFTPDQVNNRPPKPNDQSTEVQGSSKKRGRSRSRDVSPAKKKKSVKKKKPKKKHNSSGSDRSRSRSRDRSRRKSHKKSGSVKKTKHKKKKSRKRSSSSSRKDSSSSSSSSESEDEKFWVTTEAEKNQFEVKESLSKKANRAAREWCDQEAFQKQVLDTGAGYISNSNKHFGTTGFGSSNTGSAQ